MPRPGFPRRDLLLSGGDIPYDFIVGLTTLTPGMTKRAGTVFAAAPISQGAINSPLTSGDVLYSGVGSQISGMFLDYWDGNQGSVSLWFTPEEFGTNNLFTAHSGNFQIYTSAVGAIGLYMGGNISFATPAGMIAALGTKYHIVCRWDKNTLNGVNYACISVNDVHTFGGIGPAPVLTVAGANYFGSYGGNYSGNGLIEGLTVYRRPLFDGTYGKDVGNGDEINLIYNAGTGRDPCTVTGAWDVCVCFPTNASTGSMAATGDAWSFPHSSNVLPHGWLEDGFYGGGSWGLSLNGISSRINCGSDAGLDDLHAATFTAEGWFRLDGRLAGYDQLIAKSNNGSTGWNFLYQVSANGIVCSVMCASQQALTIGAFVPDSKWHHLAMTYSVADHKARIFIDGVDTSNIVLTASGAIVSDAADNLDIGNIFPVATRNLNGAIGWCRISNSKRYADGVQFKPARTPPASDANTLAQWNMTEGTGVTIDNIEGTAARDGTLTACTWRRQWEVVGSPLLPTDLYYNGTTTSKIVCAAHASLQNLQDAAMTVECWVRSDTYSNSSNYVFDKIMSGSGGWQVAWYVANTLIVYIPCATQNARSVVTWNQDAKFHHFAFTYDDAGDRKIRIFKDGTELAYSIQDAGIGAIISDAGQDLNIGLRNTAFNRLQGALGWIRISNNVRYTVAFTPPSRVAPPSNDANTVRLFKVDEGAGTALIDYSTNAQNATITTPSWINSPSMDVDDIGGRTYNWGYSIGGDGAGEGVKMVIAGATAGANYVLRGLAFSSAEAQPQLLVYDETNGATIKTLTGSFPASLDNLICSFELPTVARNGVAADCTSFSIQLLNTKTAGVIGWLQAELYANMFDDPSMDSGAAADPWIPDGWTNQLMGAGDASDDTVNIHSSGHAIALNALMLGARGIKQTVASVAAKYYASGVFIKKAGTATFYEGYNASEELIQYSATQYYAGFANSATFKLNQAVWRAVKANMVLLLAANATMDVSGYLDDAYCVALNDITIGQTPASLANSLESGGIRVDGRDQLTQPIPAGKIKAQAGWIRFSMIPRHASGDVIKYGNTFPNLVTIYGDGNNYIIVRWQAAGTFLLYLISGGAAISNTVAYTMTAGLKYKVEIIYTASYVRLKINGAVLLTVPGAVKFTVLPNIAYWGSTWIPDNDVDAVLLAP